VGVESPAEFGRITRGSGFTRGSAGVVTCGNEQKSEGPCALLAGINALRPWSPRLWSRPFIKPWIGWYMSGMVGKFGTVPEPCIWIGGRKDWG